MTREVDVAILGAGSAGLYALSQVRRATDNWVLIDGGELGTTCARVGCMPSKAIIQIAHDYHRRHHFRREGIVGAEGLDVDLARVMERTQDLRDIFVDKVLSTSIDNMDEAHFLPAHGRFVAPDTLQVGEARIRARAIIIATGSHPRIPEAWKPFRDRILTSDDFFEQETLPERMAVIGLGVIGLELGQALARLGVETVGIDIAQRIGGLTDPAVADRAVELLGKEFPMWLGAPAEITELPDGRLRVEAGEHETVVDRLLVTMGRVPNTAGLGLEHLGVPLDEFGVPHHDPHTLQVGDLPVFIAGDVTGSRPLLHEAGDEGRIAGYNAVHLDAIRRFARKVPLSITFSDPNLVRVGASLDELSGAAVVVGEANFGMLGRAILLGENRGLLRVYADAEDGRLLGAEMCVPGGEHIGHLLAWAIEQERTVSDLLALPWYHPTLEEGLQAALYDLKRKLELEKRTPWPPELRPLAD
ncbi:MAG: dihydrolipoyl dehydrogenase [Gammaproteobacteria bacterium]|nr:MAG: dihydrolipoyl dehydrogenase [Gammaproteobacteria bacterium]